MVSFKKISIITILSFNILNIVNARTIYNVPQKLNLQEVNPTVKHKIQTRYSTEEEIANQYKGKLKYKPDNNAIENYKLNRVYVTIHGSSNQFKLREYKLNGAKLNDNIFNIDTEKVGINVGVGYYFTNAFAIEFEYLNMNNYFKLKSPNYITNSNGGEIDKYDMSTYGYFVNLSVESNYAKLVPIIGAGIGYINASFESFKRNGVSTNEKIDVEGKLAYNYFIGAEYQLLDSLFVSVKYKVVETLGDNFIKKESDDADTANMQFSTRLLEFGIKYLW